MGVEHPVGLVEWTLGSPSVSKCGVGAGVLGGRPARLLSSAGTLALRQIRAGLDLAVLPALEQRQARMDCETQ